MSSYLTYGPQGDIKWVAFIRYSTVFREHGPCRINVDGDVSFSQLSNGDFYDRRAGPTKINSEGTVAYYARGSLHRLDGPAIIHSDGRKEYFITGVKHTADEFFLKFGVL